MDSCSHITTLHYLVLVAALFPAGRDWGLTRRTWFIVSDVDRIDSERCQPESGRILALTGRESMAHCAARQVFAIS